jgi:glyceraldehyde 3-phosphate dehydrogenase
MHKYDTVHGRYPGTVGSEEGKLIVDGNPITLFEERDPSSIPWGDAGVDYVLECTGLFPASEQARAHFDGGAKKVVVSQPSPDAPMFVMGVNHLEYEASMDIVSNASCTTNCLAPLAKVINDNFGLKEVRSWTFVACEVLSCVRTCLCLSSFLFSPWIMNGIQS